MLEWTADDRFVLGSATFQILPDDWTPTYDSPLVDMGGTDLFVFKPRTEVEQFIELLEALQPQRVVELGVFHGGSTALIAQVARPRCLVAIDKRPLPSKALEDYLGRSEVGERVRLYGGVDQADRVRLVEIVDEAFDGGRIDLVIDDCSHLYEATRASFSELFPRLRPGGLYVIEDWAPATLNGWGVVEGSSEIPLTRFIFELMLAVASVPTDLINEVAITTMAVLVTRGEAEVDPRGFEMADHLTRVVEGFWRHLASEHDAMES